MKKAIRQHLEMDEFFADFSMKNLNESNATSKKTTTLPQPSGSQVAELEKMAQTVRGCQKCELHTTRTHAVPGEGHNAARIMFVGEAPGADEDAQGRPFVGKAGQLLEKIIKACGLAREDVFIANILKCRPPGNRDPKPAEIIHCLPYLQTQIMLIRPKVIVALGAHAARTILNSAEAIGKLRGQFHPYPACDTAGPIKVMPTYHPAYLLRNYSTDNRRRVWEDMKKVMTEIGMPV
jgi:uracil-DNA glycosylase